MSNHHSKDVPLRQRRKFRLGIDFSESSFRAFVEYESGTPSQSGSLAALEAEGQARGDKVTANSNNPLIKRWKHLMKLLGFYLGMLIRLLLKHRKLLIKLLCFSFGMLIRLLLA